MTVGRLAAALAGDDMAPCVESAELLLLADEQLCSPLRRPPCRMPQGSGSTRFKLVKVALEGTLQAKDGGPPRS